MIPVRFLCLVQNFRLTLWHNRSVDYISCDDIDLWYASPIPLQYPGSPRVIVGLSITLSSPRFCGTVDFDHKRIIQERSGLLNGCRGVSGKSSKLPPESLDLDKPDGFNLTEPDGPRHQGIICLQDFRPGVIDNEGVRHLARIVISSWRPSESLYLESLCTLF